MKLLKNCILEIRHQRVKYSGHQKCHVVWRVV